MILNNYYNYAGNINKYSVGISGSGESTANLGLVDTSGNTQVTCYCGSVNQDIASYITATLAVLSNLKIGFGTGTTAAVATDYCLETDVTSSISNLNTNIDTSGENGQVKVTITFSGVNATDSTITISEIGIYKKLWTGWMNDYYDPGSCAYDVLLIHHILPANQRIVVPSGGSFTRTFEWVMS